MGYVSAYGDFLWSRKAYVTKNRTKFSIVENASFKVTKFVGTPLSIILHTLIFIGIFGLRFLGVNLEDILLILTTAVSLEAIYLAIFIQMSVNRTAEALEAVEDDLEDIQEDVEDISEDIEEIQTKRKGLFKRLTS